MKDYLPRLKQLEESRDLAIVGKTMMWAVAILGAFLFVL